MIDRTRGGSAAIQAHSADVWGIDEDLRSTMSQEPVDARGYFRIDVHPHNAAIFKTGDTMDRVYLIKRGRVHLVRINHRGRKSVLAILKAGDICGELAIGEEGLTAEEHAIASGETEVWSISGKEISALLGTQPTLAFDIIRAQNERVRSLQRRLRSATFQDVPSRLAQTLLQLATAVGDRCPHGGELDLRGVTQQDLSDLVGASRSFVSTLINEMKRDGYLSNVGRTLCLRDQVALRTIASKEP